MEAHVKSMMVGVTRKQITKPRPISRFGYYVFVFCSALVFTDQDLSNGASTMYPGLGIRVKLELRNTSVSGRIETLPRLAPEGLDFYASLFGRQRHLLAWPNFDQASSPRILKTDI